MEGEPVGNQGDENHIIFIYELGKFNFVEKLTNNCQSYRQCCCSRRKYCRRDRGGQGRCRYGRYC